MSSRTLGYSAVMVVLAGYFTWIMLRMANFERGGDARLTRLAIGIGAVVIGPLLILMVFRVVRGRDSGSES